MLIFYHRALLGSLCRRYIEVIRAQGRMGQAKGESPSRASVIFAPTRVLSRIYRLLPIGRRPKLPRGVRWHDPPEIFMRWDAICCILRHNFEKCCSVRTDLIESGWFFRYSYLYSVMLTIFFFGGGGSWAFWGGGQSTTWQWPVPLYMAHSSAKS